MGRDSYPWYRKSKRCWYATLYGRQHRLHPDKAEAFRLWHELVNAGEGTESGPVVGQALAEYLAHCEATLKPRTVQSKREVLDLLIPEWRSRPVAGITAGAVRAWIDSHATWGPSRRWLAGLVIRAAFRWLKHPLEALGLPGPRSRGVEAIIPPGHRQILLEAAPHETRQCLLFLAATGCRPGELCAICSEHVSPGVDLITLHIHKTSRKSNRPRMIILSRQAQEIIQTQIQRWPTGPLFHGGRGAVLTVKGLGIWMYRNCKRLGLPAYTPYGFRHTFATDLLVEGIPDALVAQLLGHSGTTILHKHYSHLSAHLDALRQAAERIQRPPGGA